MRFSTREDIEAPIDYVFGQLSDFEGLERSALRRGAEIQRIDSLGAPGPGMTWQTAFDMRGKRRNVRLELVEYDPPNAMRFDGVSSNMECEMLVDCVALSRGRTRVTLTIDLAAKNLSARLLLQSLKLAKSNLTKRFEMRVASFARDMEDRYTRRA